MIPRPDALDARGRWPVDVEVWAIPIPAGSSQTLSAFAQHCTEDEQQRIARFRRIEDRLRFAATRATLRRLLGERMDAPPLALRFSADAYGRPMLQQRPDLSFNVSHAGEVALIAISASRVVGIDVEQLKADFDWPPLLDLVCTDDERVAIAACHEAQRTHAFFRCWTAKEALVKALGVGITEQLRSLSIDDLFSQGTQQPRTHAGGSAANALRFHWLDDVPGHVGCIAYGQHCAHV